MSDPKADQRGPVADAFTLLRPEPFSFIKQVEAAVAINPVGFPSIPDLPSIVWKSRRFVLESHLDRKRSKGRRSWITAHGDFLAELGPGDGVKGVVWSCRICGQRNRPQFFVAQSTSSSIRHLCEEHSIRGDPNEEEASLTVLKLQGTAAAKRPAGSTMTKAQTTLIHDLAIGYIVNSNLPFSTFNDPFLNAMLSRFDPKLARDISLGRHTLTKDLERVYQLARAAVKGELDEAVTSIHISFDCWTSPNQLAMIAVIGHFLNQDLEYQTRLLALRRHRGDHSGENIARTIEKVIRDWGIESRIGVSICDNAFNNDTCLAALYPRLNPRFKPDDVKHRRMRCFGHILNLVAKAFLYGDDADAFELDGDHLEQLDDQERALRHWRRKGPVGKLHNIVRFIRASPQRMEAFKKAGIEEEAGQEPEIFSISEPSRAELELKQNNTTRWNSTYLMIKRAWEKHAQIQTYLNSLELEGPASGRVPVEDHLYPDDWRVLGEIQQALEPIYRMTMWAEARNSSRDGKGQLWSLQTGIEYVLEHLEHLKGLYHDESADQITALAQEQTRPQPNQPTRRRHRQPRRHNEAALPEYIRAAYTNIRIVNMQSRERAYMRASINNAWVKLDYYYALLAESPLFAAAVILHPGHGLPFLEEVWSDQGQWLVDAKQDLEAYFNRWYRHPEASRDPFSPSPSPGSQQQQQGPQEEPNQFEQWFKSRKPRPQGPDDEEGELQRYYRLRIEQVDDPVRWWADRRAEFPRLSHLALDILAIPAMAADCERVFSIAKLMITSQRHRLQDLTIEMMQLLKHWIGERAVKIGNVEV